MRIIPYTRRTLFVLLTLAACSPAPKQDRLDPSLRDSKALVLVFSATDCPLSKIYLPKLLRMERGYRERGIRFAPLYSNFADTPGQPGLPVIHDADGLLAKHFDAKRTPEVFVLDPAVRYRGAIEFAPKPKPSEVTFHRDASRSFSAAARSVTARTRLGCPRC